jgi:hypothetical protein
MNHQMLMVMMHWALLLVLMLMLDISAVSRWLGGSHRGKASSWVNYNRLYYACTRVNHVCMQLTQPT